MSMHNNKRFDLRASYYDNFKVTHVRNNDKRVSCMLISSDEENGCLYLAVGPKVEPKIIHASFINFNNSFTEVK